MGCEGINFYKRGNVRSASEIPSDKVYVDHLEDRHTKLRLFKEILFYRSSSDRSVVHIGYFLALDSNFDDI